MMTPFVIAQSEEAALAVEVDPSVVITAIVFIAVVIGIAIYAARNWTGSIDEFYLGGRRMKNFVVAMSAQSSARSAWLILGVSGTAFVEGVSAVWTVVGYVVMELFLYLFAAPRLRRFTGRMNNITLADYFASRFRGSQAELLRMTTIIVIVLFMVAYVSAQFAAGGTAFASSFGVSANTGIWLTAAIVLLYTIVGGYVAVAYTDVVMALLMVVGLTLLPLMVIMDIGYGPMLDTLAALDPATVDPLALGIGGTISFLGIAFGSPGNPHIIVRYMSVDDPARLRYSAMWATGWNILTGWGAVLVGMSGRAYFGDVEALPDADPEQLFPVLASEYLPGIIVGLMVAAIFSAIMSTADSQLLVASSGVVRDLYQRTFRPSRDLSQRHYVIMSRVVILVMVLVAIGLLYLPGAEELVFWLVLFAWGGLGAAFGPPLLFSLFWKRTTGLGALSGIVVGAVSTVAWYYIPGLTDIVYEGVPGFIFSALAVWVGSLLTQKPADVDRIFSEMKDPDHLVTGEEPRS